MPLTREYLDRCAKESVHDKDSFLKFWRVLLLSPTPKLLKGIRSRVAAESQIRDVSA